MAQYHFIGIGGIGMGKLASLLLSKGETVSGSDIADNAMVKSLRDQGARIVIGHQAENIGDAKNVVYSSAIRPENPEMAAALQKGCSIIKRAKLLADLMKDAFGVTVAGAHGKTTTTSMIAHMLIQAGLDPTVALGGVFKQGSYQEKLGHSNYFVAELDESDGSFLFFSPRISVVTNIDFEHVDYYKDWDHILAAYAQFIGQTHDDGVVAACGDDARLRQIVQESRKPALYYGLGEHNDFYAQNIYYENGRMVFRCIRGHQDLGQISLGVYGVHNAVNALACVIVGLRLGLSFAVIQQALASYQGVRRRLEAKGSWGDTRLVDDYAHHPTEIKATLAAVKALNPKRVVVLFQPHRYTRTKFLWNEFLEAFNDADELMITDVYAASEDVLQGVDARSLCNAMSLRSRRPVVYTAKEKAAACVAAAVQPGDYVITLGAGDITKICDDLARILEEKLMVKYG